MTKRNTEGDSHPPEKPQPPQTPKIEIDFESLIAIAIGEVVVKRSKKQRGLKSNWRP